MIGITGSTGVLGSILRAKLDENGTEYSCFIGDLRSKQDLKNWLQEKGQEFDAIIHLAAMVPTKQVNENQLDAYDVNVAGTLNLLLTLEKLQLKPWLFYASTSHVYKSSNQAIDENYTISPISAYGKTKQMAEQICLDYSQNEHTQFPICCGRIFSYYHETQAETFLYKAIQKRLADEDLAKPFFLYGADSKRDFLNAEQVIDIVMQLMAKRAEGVINIASGQATKIRDFVQSMTDVQLNIETNDDVPDSLVANIDKLTQILEN